VRRVRADRECRVLILSGAGNTFCAGDIKEFNEWRGDEAYWQVRMYQETVQIIEDLTPVTIAAVQGVCTGGGLELTLVCDFVIATALFSGVRAKEYGFVNRVVRSGDELDDQVRALTEVMLAKHPRTVRRTKFIMDKGADLHRSGALAFEVPIMPYVTGAQGDQGLHDRRRTLEAPSAVERLLAGLTRVMSILEGVCEVRRRARAHGRPVP
jgi:enoyl-CoA hydratase/carnithine racemase